MKFRIKFFATRLSLYTIIFTIIIFSVIMITFYIANRRTIIKNAIENTHSLLYTMAVKIDDKLNMAEIALINCEWMVKENINQPDSLYKIIKSLVINNEVITGSAIAFEPNYYPQKGEYFMLYGSEDARDSTIVEIKKLGDEKYHYFTMDWYQIPKLLNKNYWSEPYFDKNGGNYMMCTFSRPIYDDSGKLICIFTADISLSQFTDIVNSLEPYESSYSFMLSRNGYYITHYKKDRIMSETIFSNAFLTKNKQYEQVGHDMIDGKTGTIEFDNNGEVSYAFYTSIPDIGWSICNVCPADIILSDLHSATIKIFILFCIGVILLFISTFLVIKRLSKPLEDFSLSAQQIAHGNFNVKLPKVKSHDEMETLHNSFAKMQESLVKYIEDLKISTTNNQRIESELNIAREIQMGMLPKIFPPFPERLDVDLGAVLHPAREVGGDLYDFFIEDNRLYFAIGDVSGKGVPASLVMTITSSIFRSIAPSTQDTRHIIAAINKAVCEGNSSNMFVTMIVGILDLSTGNMDICNAGHNPFITVTPDGDTNYAILNQNLPIGIINDFEYENNKFTLRPNSKIILYTDGITEAENEMQQLYSEKRLLDIISQYSSDSVNILIDKILSSVHDHVKETPQSDDLTLLVINYKPLGMKQLNKELVIFNDNNEILKIQAFVEEIGESLNLSMAMVTNINLALEEAVANVIMYAYPPPEKNIIHLYAAYTDNKLTFILTDKGIPFDPTQATIPDINLPIEERPIGGLGILIVRKIMDEVTYNRIDSENHLTLIKKF